MTLSAARLAMMALVLFGAMFAWALPVSAQAFLTWEPYGTLIIDGPSSPVFMIDGRMLYAGDSNTIENIQYVQGLFSMLPPIDSSSRWDILVDALDDPIYDSVYAISEDTLLASGHGFFRSVDAGTTWTRLDPWPNPYPDIEQWYEVPQGVPYAGRILGAARYSMAIYSDDRGASFQTAEQPKTAAPDAEVIRLTSVTAGPNAGRILGGGLSGITKSDDGGHTWSQTPEWAYFSMDAACIGTLKGQAPGGGDRVVTLINDTRIPDDSLRISISDDGGDTWLRPQAVLQGHFRSCVDIVDLGEGRAVEVLKRGPIYGTEDAGETWTKWSDWPGPAGEAGVAVFTKWATLGPDGHLYVGLSHNSAPNVFDVRTTVPVGMSTIQALPPVQESELSLSLRPNPSDGRVTVFLESVKPETMRVSLVDALGREVALVYEGAVAGRREMALDTTGLAPGVYVLRASSGGRADVTTRFTVVR